MEDKRESFNYTYSAREQEEIRRIRSRYAPPAEDKMEQLRRLDRSAAQKGTAVSLIAGITGALALGIGMCCVLVWGGVWFAVGIPVGLVGMALAAAAYPLYVRVTRREREKIAPEVLRLTDELMK